MSLPAFAYGRQSMAARRRLSIARFSGRYCLLARPILLGPTLLRDWLIFGAGRRDGARTRRRPCWMSREAAEPRNLLARTPDAGPCRRCVRWPEMGFALAAGAKHIVVADRTFIAAMGRHPDPLFAGMLLTLSEWSAGRHK